MKEQLMPPIADGQATKLVYNDICSLESLISQPRTTNERTADATNC